jgi:hypothetical protein
MPAIWSADGPSSGRSDSITSVRVRPSGSLLVVLGAVDPHPAAASASATQKHTVVRWIRNPAPVDKVSAAPQDPPRERPAILMRRQ